METNDHLVVNEIKIRNWLALKLAVHRQYQCDELQQQYGPSQIQTVKRYQNTHTQAVWP